MNVNKNVRTKEARKNAVKFLSEKNGYSFSVASHIIDCMSIKTRKQFLNKFK